MCAVSAIHEYYYRQPQLWGQFTPQTFADLKQVLERLDAIDRKLGDRDCADPIKQQWMAEVERRLKAIESS